jgi:DNA-directed RNA polymerase specialized sigma24 family protein
VSDDLKTSLERVRRAAREGAKSATRSPPLIDFAEERAVEHFEDAVLQGKGVGNLVAWAYMIGRNAALAGFRAHRGKKLRRLEEWDQPVGTEGDSVLSPGTRQQLKDWLRRHPTRITVKQLRVAKLLASGCSYHRAAKKLRMDRSNLKRMFNKALRRLILMRP